MKKEKLKPAAVVRAVHEAKGLAYIAARKLKCHPNTIFNYARRYKQVQDAIDEARAVILDTTENKLFDAVEAGEAWAVQFLLRTIGKERGYVERSEHTGKAGEPMAVGVTIQQIVSELQRAKNDRGDRQPVG